MTPPHISSPVILHTAALADQGTRDRQEDATLHEPRAGLFGVFDGLGAYPKGAENSAAAARLIFGHWSRDGQPRSDGGLLRAWQAACADMDRTLHHGDTTATVGMLLGGGRCLVVLHIGDSGVTCVDARGVRRMTERHGEGRWCKRALRGGGSFLRPKGDTEPDLHIIPLIPGDVLIIHTDGLDAVLEDHAAVMAACQDRDPQTIARRLIEGARARGEGDNASLVVLVVEAGPQDAPAAISREGLEAAGRWAGVGVDGGLVVRGLEPGLSPE